MKITKNASGEQIVKLSQEDWTDFGKKAGWLDGEGNLVESEEIVREAQPGIAPPRPKTTPKAPPRRQKPGKFDPMKPAPRTPSTPDPAPKAEESEELDIAAKVEEKIEVEAEVSADNLPTIASELKKKIIKNDFALSLEANSKDPYYDTVLKLAADFKSTHSYSRDFWANLPEDHPFSQFSFLVQNGAHLAENNWKYITDRIEARDDKIVTDAQIMQIVTVSRMIDMAETESGHHEELSNIAKNLVAELWGVDPDILNAEFMDEPGTTPEEERQFEAEDVEITPELRNEINKRMTINSLAHGASLNAMMSMHHMASEDLGAISELGPQGEISDTLQPLKRQIEMLKPQMDALGVNTDFSNESLMEKYTKFSELVLQHYYHLDLGKLADKPLADVGIGETKVQTPQEAEEGEEAVEDTTITGRGLVFPALCQELVKGVIEVISGHGRNPELSPDQIKKIYNEADKLEYEPYLIMVGPELWRKFLKSAPEGLDHGQLLGRLSREPAEEFLNIVNDVIENPDAVSEKLNQYLGEVEQEDADLKEWEEEEEKAQNPWINEPEGIEEGEEIEEVEEGEIEDLNKDLAGLFDDMGQVERSDRPNFKPGFKPDFGQADQGFPNVDLDDDFDKPFWMN